MTDEKRFQYAKILFFLFLAIVKSVFILVVQKYGIYGNKEDFLSLVSLVLTTSNLGDVQTHPACTDMNHAFKQIYTLMLEMFEISSEIMGVSRNGHI